MMAAPTFRASLATKLVHPTNKERYSPKDPGGNDPTPGCVLYSVAMKTILLLGFSVLTAVSLAQGKPAVQPKTPTTIKCAVEGGPVNIAKATKNHMYADYKGNRYFFCCDGCPQEFKKNPTKFANAPHIPTPKTK